MYIYLESLYSTWSSARSPEQCRNELDCFIKLASTLLHHSEDEVRTALRTILQ